MSITIFNKYKRFLKAALSHPLDKYMSKPANEVILFPLWLFYFHV